MTFLIEAVGWIGSALVLAAYLLVTTDRLSGQSAAFQWMNLVGAAGLTVNAFWHRALPPAVLDLAWMLIGVVALFRLAARHRAS